MVAPLIYAGALAFFAYAQYRDASISEIGYAAHYVEGNELVAKIFGQHPSLAQLITYNVIELAVLSSVAFFVGLPWAIGAALAAAGKHLMAVRKWKMAFATNGKSLLAARSVWQKILGL